MADFLPLTPAEMQVQQAAIDRQRAIAMALQQASLQAPEGQMVSGHYVAPNPTQYLAKLAQGLIGKNQQEDLDKKQVGLATQQGDMLRAQFGIGGQQSAPLPSQAVQAGLAQGAQVGDVGPTNTNLARVAAALQSQPQQSSSTGTGSLVLEGMNPVQAFQAYNSDPKAYWAAYLKQFEPTEKMKNNRYLGISSDEDAAFERASRTKAGLMEGQPGNTVYNPVTGKPVFVAPNFNTGLAGGFDQFGNPIITRIAGSEAIPQIAGETKRAEAGAQADFDMVTVNTPQGPRMVTRAQAARMAGSGASNSQPGQSGLDLSKLTPEQQAYLAKTNPQAFANGVADFQRTSTQQPQQAQTGGIGIPLESEADKTYKLEKAKQQAKQEDVQPEATFSVKTAVGTIDNALKQVDNLLQSPGLSHITGTLAGRTPNVSDVANNAQANLDTLKAQIGVHVLNAMREASKTGGAVGSVTEKEWPIIQNQLGALQQTQTTDQFKKGLNDVKETLNRVRDSYVEQYESRYGTRKDIRPNTGWSIKLIN